ncbi:hypothetical protein B0H17DRAFT_1144613 [Mycena rosella]|uniref:C2H2-type domain-containing protein n=1 Tax=Mycena rosella TaxID=1033263 RepID=A0AAD7CSI2_MYCRO|nr:hypothetical protein B0H17DRAFT_1144613 [Mycena rosella]
MQRNVNYPYPDPGYPASGSPPAGGYSQSYEQPGGGRSQYPPTSNGRGHYYPPIAPAPPSSSSQYRTEYSPPPGYPSQYTAPDSRGYQPGSDSYLYNSRAVSPPASYHHRRSSGNQPPPRKFIPTPSEVYANPRPPRPPSSALPGHSSRAGSYSTVPPHPILPPAARPHPPSHSSRPRSSMGPLPIAGPSSTERYPCDVCGKDFSRAHDRKRHHETQHAATPITHKCIYCDKDFSRADSLKRHIQNGCDEAPPS